MKKRKEKLLIVQPHSDDALFSASHFFLVENYAKKFETTVLTVENNSKRIAEDKKLYEFLEINYINLSENIPEFEDNSFYGFSKSCGDDVTVDKSLDWLIGSLGNDVVDSVCNAVVDFINCRLDYDKIALPLGIGHPFHIFVRALFESRVKEEKLIFYRDFPHSYKRKSRNQFERVLEQHVIYESVDVSDFHDVKWDLAKKFYKTQSGLLWYEQGYINKQLPEEVYKKL